MGSVRKGIQDAVRFILQSFGLTMLYRTKFSHSAPRRVLLYASSVVGLGHLARLCRVAERMLDIDPSLNILLISDKEDLSLFELASRFAILNLPGYAFYKQNHNKEIPRKLNIGKFNLNRLRTNILRSAIHSFQPHLLVVETLPHGKRDELVPCLNYIVRFRPHCRRILFLRDIPLAPTEKDFSTSIINKIEKFHTYYHHILVSGDKRFFDLTAEYNWDERIAKKIHYTGFMVPVINQPSQDLPSPHKRIVASFGGGWEIEHIAFPLLESFLRLDNQSQGQEYEYFIYTGPAVSDELFSRLCQYSERIPKLTIKKFSRDFAEILAGADVAILQAGSTPFQIINTSIPIILYCRDYRNPEQQHRAKLLSQYDGITLLDKNQMEPEYLSGLLSEALTTPIPKRETGLNCNGIENATNFLIEQLKLVERMR
ncbi:hypothetical protein J7M23_07960 [Candidatus Sumerlaeota bacterium]|nr:hypothetical protein [Candidatus Sumerlaeota bacterium]